MPDYDAGTALVVVDVQNDFADAEGSLYVKEGEEVVGFINLEIAKARDGGSVIVFTQDWHPPDTPHFSKDGGTWPVHCVGGTWGAELHPDLEAGEDATRVRKGTRGEDGYSGFNVADPDSGEKSKTELEELLRDKGVGKAVVVGLATDYCVKSTALDSVDIGFKTYVLKAGVRAVNLQPGDGQAALDELASAGVILH